MLEFRLNAFLNENSQAVLCFCWNSCLWLVADCRSCFWDPFVPLLSTAKLEPLFYFGLVRFTLLRPVTDVSDYQGGQEGIFARSLLSKSSSPQYHHWHHEQNHHLHHNQHQHQLHKYLDFILRIFWRWSYASALKWKEQKTSPSRRGTCCTDRVKRRKKEPEWKKKIVKRSSLPHPWYRASILCWHGG